MQRVLFTALALVLAGLLAWLLWWWLLLPGVYFASLPIVDYDALAVPPLPFVAEDVAAFSRLPQHGSPVVLGDLQTSTGIVTLANRLRGFAAKPRDTLILYLRLYGVSDGGKALVVCSDYLRTPQGGLCPLADLLAQIEQSPTRLKLVILDAGDLACNARLGLFVNEFPQLLDEEVRRIDDPGLWILVSHRPLEVSHVSQSAKRSAFAHFVVEGLGGAADRDGNGMVELAELLEFVRSGVTGWVGRQSGGDQTQTPWLLHGGQGAADAPPGLKLLTISDRNQKGADDQEGQSPAAAKPAADDVALLLEKAWKLRDGIELPFTAGPVTPIDYAPHLWRAYQELLLNYERRYRGGTEYDPTKLADDLRANILPADSLTSGKPLPATVGRDTIVGRLADAGQQYDTKLRADWLNVLEKDPRSNQYLGFIGLRNMLVFHATDYVRWHAAYTQISARKHRLYQPIADLLAQLRVFVDQLDAFETALAAPSGGNQIADALSALSQQSEKLQLLWKTIDDGLDKDADELIDAATKNPSRKGIAGPIDALLATPLLREGRRTRLLRARATLQEPFAAADQSANAAHQPRSLSAWSSQLSDQAALEEQLAKLANPAAALSPPPSVDAANVGSLLRSYRTFSSALGNFYRRLPAEINRDFQPGDLAAIHRCGRLLRAVDSRDAEHVRKDAAAITLPPARFPAVEESRLAIEGPSETVPLEPEGRPTAFKVAVQAGSHPPGAAQWMMTYDPNELTVSIQGVAVPAEKWTEFSLDKAVTPLEFVVISKASGGRETSLTVRVRSGDKSETRRFPLRLPAPDVVDLVVHQIVGAAERPVAGPDGYFRLRPFPNRVNRYRFALVNRSGRAKNVTVEWLSVPELPPGQKRSRDVVFDASGNPLPGLQSIVAPLEMKLPATDDAVPIGFPEPKPPAAAKGAAAPEAKPAAAPETPPAPPLPSPYMVCVIRDAASGEIKSIKWLNLAARPPREYVTPRVSYSAREGKIRIDVQPGPADELPPLSRETPITVVWDTQGSLGPNVAVKNEDIIAAAGQTASLDADLGGSVENSENKVVPVRLTVDGYPRAFVYEVKCDDRDRSNIPPDRDRRWVHFARPLPDQAFRVPLAAPIPVELEVDAPDDAFRQSGDAVELRIIAADSDTELCPKERRRFFSDRQTTVTLQRLTAQGEMQLQVNAGPFQFPVAAAGQKNVKLRIQAELLLADRVAARDAVRVALDDRPPVFEIRVPGRPVPRGQNVPVAVDVTYELSGVEKIEFGFDLQNNEDFDKKVEPVVVRQPAADGAWHAALPSKDLEPGQYRVLVRVTDRVGFARKQWRLVTIGPAETREAPVVVKTSTVTGSVTLQDGTPLSNIHVTLRDTDLSADTDSEGRYTIRDVPHGSYTIAAKGTAKGHEVSGTKKITLPAAVEPAVVNFSLEW